MNVTHDGLDWGISCARRLFSHSSLLSFIFLALTYETSRAEALPLLPPQVAADILANRSGIDLSHVLLSYTYKVIPQPAIDIYDKYLNTVGYDMPPDYYSTYGKDIDKYTYTCEYLMISPDQFYFKMTEDNGKQVTEHSSNKTYQAIYGEHTGIITLVRDARPGVIIPRYSSYAVGFPIVIFPNKDDNQDEILFSSIKEHLHGNIEVAAGKMPTEQVIKFMENTHEIARKGEVFYQREVTLKLDGNPKVSEYTIKYAGMCNGMITPNHPSYKVEYGDYTTFAQGVDLPKTIRIIEYETIPKKKTGRISDNTGLPEETDIYDVNHYEFTLNSARIVSDAEAARLCSPRLDEKPDGTWVIDEISGNKYIKGNPLAKSLKALEELKKKP